MDLSSLSEEVDLTAALDRLCDDDALLLELLETLILEFKNEQIVLLDSVLRGEYGYVATKAHYFKGIAANLEFLHFRDAAKALEQFAKSADQAMCQEEINRLIACSQRLDSLLANLARN